MKNERTGKIKIIRIHPNSYLNTYIPKLVFYSLLKKGFGLRVAHKNKGSLRGSRVFRVFDGILERVLMPNCFN